MRWAIGLGTPLRSGSVGFLASLPRHDHRDQLARLCVEGSLALGDRLVEAERWREAAAAYRTVLDRDPLHEASYRQLMRCMTHIGERTQALRLYQRLSDTLRAELATTPAAETVRLYQQLQSSAD